MGAAAGDPESERIVEAALKANEDEMMTAKKGHYGSGSIDRSGENSWRIRYRIKGVRYTKVG
jgi:hypothetical protein